MSKQEDYIRQRVAGRNHAKDILSLIEVSSLSTVAAQSMWEELRDTALKNAPLQTAQPTVLPPFTDVQAKIFGQTIIHFGIHAGARVDEAPLEYLVWLDEQSGFKFREDLRRYLWSPQTQHELDNTTPPETDDGNTDI